MGIVTLYVQNQHHFYIIFLSSSFFVKVPEKERTQKYIETST